VTKKRHEMWSKSKLRKQRPKVRDHYADDMILEYLDRNPDGVTITQIVGKTELVRNTVMRHLERFVALRSIRKRDFGHIALYFKTGYFDEENEESHLFENGTSYAFQLVERGVEGNYIYVKEKQIGDFREEKVTGGIMINTKDAEKFVKLLHTFAMKVDELESGK